jgi:2-hydroxy-6-oxo-6-(2'-carboxyphenyl)-hexa-2,4-dienoate hydrolase
MTDDLPDRLDENCVRWVDVDALRTRYYETGDGEPLVLLHGGVIGSLYSLDSWSLVFPLLSQWFRVIAPDRLGQGYTDNPPTETYRPEMMLRHAEHFFDVVGIRNAHVVGHSRGGLIATWLAQHRPELVKTLVIVNSRSIAPEDPRYPNDVFYERLGHRQRLLAGEVTLETVAVEPAAQSYRQGNLTADFLERMLKIARLPKTEVARARVRINRESNWLAPSNALRTQALQLIDLQGLRVPTLIVWGFDDLSAPLPVGIQLFERIAATTPVAEMHVLNQARHYCFRDQPEAFVAAVQGFCGRF